MRVDGSSKHRVPIVVEVREVGTQVDEELQDVQLAGLCSIEDCSAPGLGVPLVNRQTAVRLVYHLQEDVQAAYADDRGQGIAPKLGEGQDQLPLIRPQAVRQGRIAVHINQAWVCPAVHEPLNIAGVATCGCVVQGCAAEIVSNVHVAVRTRQAAAQRHVDGDIDEARNECQGAAGESAVRARHGVERQSAVSVPDRQVEPRAPP
mmetsp:Transcript_109024/g.314955  ORF Transcript_109024/g.314955 Transcript_109024/m.314955 type:complete len:205 (-) Transcript_109024:1211-1825(-)